MEYKTVTQAITCLPYEAIWSGEDKKLNQMAARGWEVVSVTMVETPTLIASMQKEGWRMFTRFILLGRRKEVA